MGHYAVGLLRGLLPLHEFRSVVCLPGGLSAVVPPGSRRPGAGVEAGQGVAGKGPGVDGGPGAAGEGQGFQAFAFFEGIASDVAQALRQGQLLQAWAVGEAVIADFSHALLNFDGGDPGAGPGSRTGGRIAAHIVLPDDGKVGQIFQAPGQEPGILGGVNGQLLDAVAAQEGILRHIRLCRDHQAFQIGAVPEGAVRHGLHRIRQGQLLQAAQAPEGVGADIGDSLPELDPADLVRHLPPGSVGHQDPIHLGGAEVIDPAAPAGAQHQGAVLLQGIVRILRVLLGQGVAGRKVPVLELVSQGADAVGPVLCQPVFAAFEIVQVGVVLRVPGSVQAVVEFAQLHNVPGVVHGLAGDHPCVYAGFQAQPVKGRGIALADGGAMDQGGVGRVFQGIGLVVEILPVVGHVPAEIVVDGVDLLPVVLPLQV